MKPREHKTVQARILKYAQEIGWTYVPRAEAERQRGFDPDGATPQDRARKASLFFGELAETSVCANYAQTVAGMSRNVLDPAISRGRRERKENRVKP